MIEQQAEQLPERQRVELDALGDWVRTCDCNSLQGADLDREVTLMGWVHRRRDHGGLIFIDLRDRAGVTQVVFDPDVNAEAHVRGHNLRSEDVIAVRGVVRNRPEGMANPKLTTGEIEVAVRELRILNISRTPPFQIEDDLDASENVRLRYRYLDLRRPKMLSSFVLRHKVAQITRNYFSEHGFLEVETPVMTKSTPEGARDFLVPSRNYPGKFFALPQSPQLFKQLLMVAGLDRYMQIVKCFRDEDLRADRQPEFTQVDLEMTFAHEELIIELIEGWIEALFHGLLGVEVNFPLPRMTYDEAMRRYGCDRPDLRFDLELVEITDIVAESDFRVFRQAVERGGMVKTLKLPGGASLSRKELDDLIEYVKQFGAQGMAWIKIQPDAWQSPITKFLSDGVRERLAERLAVEPGDILFFVADVKSVVNDALANLRVKLGKRFFPPAPSDYRFLWVTEFPLLEWSAEQKRYTAVHHPFTAPMDEDLELLEEAPERVRSRAYDLVLNGTELGGGSIRIHRRDLQERVFRALGIGQQEAEEKFDFLLEALQYGAPPHGGIAFGFDRLIAMMAGLSSIRDVIAFPKTQRATCLTSGAPAEPAVDQLLELCLKVEGKPGR